MFGSLRELSLNLQIGFGSMSLAFYFYNFYLTDILVRVLVRTRTDKISIYFKRLYYVGLHGRGSVVPQWPSASWRIWEPMSFSVYKATLLSSTNLARKVWQRPGEPSMFSVHWKSEEEEF